MMAFTHSVRKIKLTVKTPFRPHLKKSQSERGYTSGLILISAQGKLLGSTPGMLTSICAPKQIVRL
jgi:hypothetical protein